jgi:hypothetical protein
MLTGNEQGNGETKSGRRETWGTGPGANGHKSGQLGKQNEGEDHLKINSNWKVEY